MLTLKRENDKYTQEHIEAIESLQIKLTKKESDLIQLEEYLTALTGKNDSHNETVMPNILVVDQLEELQKIVNSLKDENVALENEKSALQDSLSQFEKYLEPSDVSSSNTAADIEDQKCLPSQISISTELFNQTEKQLAELLRRLEEEKLYSSKLFTLLQVAEKELKILQDKLLQGDDTTDESKVEDNPTIVSANVVSTFEGKIADLTSQLRDKSRDYNDAVYQNIEKERLLSIMREELDRQTSELISFKSSINTVEGGTKKKVVGFNSNLEIFSMSDRELVTEENEMDDYEEGKSISNSYLKAISRGPSVLEFDNRVSPRVENSAKMFSPRSAAHYEAQRTVLQIIKRSVEEISLSYDTPSTAEMEVEAMPEISQRQNTESIQEAKTFSIPSSMGKVVSQYMFAVRIQKIVRSFIAKRRVQRLQHVTPKHAMAKVASQYIYAVRIQSMVRAFLARHRVRKARLEEIAQANGVLIACDGTKQGQTGWYRVQDQMFYFCIDEKEFVLLCGPISRDMYDIAVEEINQIISRTASIPMVEEGSTDSGSKSSLIALRFPHLKLPKNIGIDRLGLQATRIQIETLLDDLRTRDEYITRVEEDLSVMKKTVYISQAEAILKLNKQVEEYACAIAALKKEKEELMFKTRFVKEDLLAQLQTKIGSIDQSLSKRFVNLTAAARGFLGRRRVNRLKLFKLADETGVLVAMSNTVQGESGWYVGPHGSIFYFVLKEVSFDSSLLPGFGSNRFVFVI